jgi:uncharacterized membrane protein
VAEGKDPHLLGRLEAFSDVVFGFAVFMLATNVKVPATPEELAHAGKSLLIFGASFLVLCALWYRHHRLMRRHYFPGPTGTILVFALLGTVALYSYPLQLYLRYPGDRLVGIAYAEGFAAMCFLGALLMADGLWQRRDEADEEFKRKSIRGIVGNFLLSALMAVLPLAVEKNATPVFVIFAALIIAWRFFRGRS